MELPSQKWRRPEVIENIQSDRLCPACELGEESTSGAPGICNGATSSTSNEPKKARSNTGVAFGSKLEANRPADGLLDMIPKATPNRHGSRRLRRRSRSAQDYRIAAARRHLGRKHVVTSIDALRSAVQLYLILTAALDAHPDDELLKQMWGRAIDSVIFAQMDRRITGRPEKSKDGSIVTDLKDGRELAVWPFIHLKPKPRDQLRAKAWLARRGVLPKLDRLGDEIWQALNAGDPVPFDFFGSLGSKVVIRAKGGDPLQELRIAVDEYEDARSKVESTPDRQGSKQQFTNARFRLVRALVECHQAKIASEEPDGTPICDLGDGRELRVEVWPNLKPSKRDRSRAAEWLKHRGKKRLEEFGYELAEALKAGATWDELAASGLDHEMIARMMVIDVEIRRKL
jgi:hypothetical protein